jgi:hypothetical protein
MNRSVSLSLTADDCAAANKLQVIDSCRSPRFLVALALPLALLASALVFYRNSGVLPLVYAFAGAYVAIVALLVVNYFLVAPISARRSYRKHKALHYQYTYSWSETGLMLVHPRGESRMVWSDYLKWRENEQVFLFYHGPRIFNILPKRVLTPEQIADVRQCAAHIPE